MTDDVLSILVAAAVAFSAVELLSGPLMFRALVNRRAILRWLLLGVHEWETDKESWIVRVWDFIWPGTRLKQLSETVNGRLPSLPGSKPTGGETSEIAHDLFALATGGNRISCYRLESDQLAAQINAAAEAALDKPNRCRLVLIASARLSEKEALGSPTEPSPIADFLNLSSTVSSAQTDSTALETRHELTLRIQRRLDDLQIATRSAQRIWSQTLQIAAAIVTVWTLGSLTIPLSFPSDQMIALGTIAGFIAPLIGRALRPTAS